MTKFRPCIDLHSGSVKQIVGGTLTTDASSLRTNFVSPHSAAYFAQLYKDNKLEGAHVIMLGPGNEEAAREAVEVWKGGLQVGGGIGEGNARAWVDRGAGKVIVTSYLFPSGTYAPARLTALLAALHNDTSKLVIDLSCRRKGKSWFVATDKWQTVTNFEITFENLSLLSTSCSEFLIHAADNEGLQAGIDEDLVRFLGEWSASATSTSIPITYAGGGRSLSDLQHVADLSGGRVDLTIGSALDVFGGSGVKFEEAVDWNLKYGSLERY